MNSRIMDNSSRAGSKKGSGGIATQGAEELQRKKRINQLFQETVDLSKDPYIYRHSTGKYECRLCLTMHRDESSYLAHTGARKHRENLERRRVLDEADRQRDITPQGGASSIPKKDRVASLKVEKFNVSKIKDPITGAIGCLVQLTLPEASKPLHRFMSAYEQHVEKRNGRFQYLVIAAEPYENVAIKIPSPQIDRDSLLENWDSDNGVYTMQFLWPPAMEF